MSVPGDCNHAGFFGAPKPVIDEGATNVGRLTSLSKFRQYIAVLHRELALSA
jgi:hypothetical protein